MYRAIRPMPITLHGVAPPQEIGRVLLNESPCTGSYHIGSVALSSVPTYLNCIFVYHLCTFNDYYYGHACTWWRLVSSDILFFYFNIVYVCTALLIIDDRRPYVCTQYPRSAISIDRSKNPFYTIYISLMGI